MLGENDFRKSDFDADVAGPSSRRHTSVDLLALLKRFGQQVCVLKGRAESIKLKM